MKTLKSAISELDAQLLKEGYANIPGNEVGDFFAVNKHCPNCKRIMGVFRLYENSKDKNREAYLICEHCYTAQKMESPKYWTQAIWDLALEGDYKIGEPIETIDDYLEVPEEDFVYENPPVLKGIAEKNLKDLGSLIKEITEQYKQEGYSRMGKTKVAALFTSVFECPACWRRQGKVLHFRNKKGDKHAAEICLNCLFVQEI